MQKLDCFSGDAKFASVQQMKMLSASRRDDCINLMYLLIYFKTMDLPWCDFLFCMPCDSPEMTYKMVLSQKEQFSLTELAKQTEFSDEFQDLCKLIDNLSFEGYPNYQRITKILSGIVEMRFPDQPENRVFQWKRQL